MKEKSKKIYDTKGNAGYQFIPKALKAKTKFVVQNFSNFSGGGGV